MSTPAEPDATQRAFLGRQRVGHLATADASGAPHVMPVCYAVDGASAYIAIDAKPKQVPARGLKRLRNIAANPQVALLVDHYDDQDWSRLGWVLLRGRAEVLTDGAEHDAAIARLRERYAQYRSMALTTAPVIALRIEQARHWGRLEP